MPVQQSNGYSSLCAMRLSSECIFAVKQLNLPFLTYILYIQYVSSKTRAKKYTIIKHFQYYGASQFNTPSHNVCTKMNNCANCPSQYSTWDHIFFFSFTESTCTTSKYSFKRKIEEKNASVLRGHLMPLIILRWWQTIRTKNCSGYTFIFTHQISFRWQFSSGQRYIRKKRSSGETLSHYVELLPSCKKFKSDILFPQFPHKKSFTTVTREIFNKEVIRKFLSSLDTTTFFSASAFFSSFSSFSFWYVYTKKSCLIITKQRIFGNKVEKCDAYVVLRRLRWTHILDSWQISTYKLKLITSMWNVFYFLKEVATINDST